MFTPEQKYRLEQAKNNTPSNNAFLWVVPLMVILAWICRNDEHSTAMLYSHHSEMPTTTLKVLGWRIF